MSEHRGWISESSRNFRILESQDFQGTSPECFRARLYSVRLWHSLCSSPRGTACTTPNWTVWTNWRTSVTLSLLLTFPWPKSAWMRHDAPLPCEVTNSRRLLCRYWEITVRGHFVYIIASNGSRRLSILRTLYFFWQKWRRKRNFMALGVRVADAAA